MKQQSSLHLYKNYSKLKFKPNILKRHSSLKNIYKSNKVKLINKRKFFSCFFLKQSKWKEKNNIELQKLKNFKRMRDQMNLLNFKNRSQLLKFSKQFKKQLLIKNFKILHIFVWWVLQKHLKEIMWDENDPRLKKK